MPQIKPTSVEDLLKLIEDHRSDIENGTYDLVIEGGWVSKLSKDVLRFLVKHCPGTQKEIARSPSTPPEVLEVLAKDSNLYVRERVASNINTPQRILHFFARDPEYRVLEAVGRNPNTSPEDLKSILKISPDAVASNPNTPPEVLEVLARDTNENVRSNVARNPNTPQEALEVLAKDPSPFVALNANSNPSTPTTPTKTDSDPKKTCFIATAVYGSEITPEVILFRVYRDQVMTRYWSGKIFIKVYYALSPRIARSISNMPKIKAVIRRFVLDPLARIIRRRLQSEKPHRKM